jgi:hypothetical protein
MAANASLVQPLALVGAKLTTALPKHSPPYRRGGSAPARKKNVLVKIF